MIFFRHICQRYNISTPRYCAKYQVPRLRSGGLGGENEWYEKKKDLDLQPQGILDSRRWCCWIVV